MYSEKWVSCPNAAAPGHNGPGAEGLYNLLTGFFLSTVPDFKWSTEEHFHVQCDSGETYIHIGTAVGRPQKGFYGVEPRTGRSFHIMAIDIHHIEDGKLKTSWHVEEWLDAVGQLQN